MFKSLSVFELNNVNFTPEHLDEQLQAVESAFRPCPPTAPYTAGFVEPYEGAEAMAIPTGNRFIHVCYQSEKRMLPADVVQRKTDQRVKDLETLQERTIPKRERREIKERITEELLPEAFTRLQATHAFIDRHTHRLFIASTTRSVTEVIATRLAAAAGSITEGENVAVGHWHFCDSIQQVMGIWTQDPADTLPDSMALGDSVVIEDPLEPTTKVSFNEWDLMSDDVRGMIETGFVVSKMNLNHSSGIDFNLEADGTLRSIKYPDEFKLKSGDDPGDHFRGQHHLVAEHLIQIVTSLNRGALALDLVSEEGEAHPRKPIDMHPEAASQ